MLRAIILRRALTRSRESADAKGVAAAICRPCRPVNCNLQKPYSRTWPARLAIRKGLILPSAHLPSRNTRSRLSSRPPQLHPVSSVGRASARRQAAGILPSSCNVGMGLLGASGWWCVVLMLVPGGRGQSKVGDWGWVACFGEAGQVCRAGLSG